MIISKNKVGDLTFEGGKVYFYKIINSHLAQEGEDWEFVVLRENKYKWVCSDECYQKVVESEINLIIIKKRRT